jgi:hypothetical protein
MGRKMLVKGMSHEDVSEVTGLPVEEISVLAASVPESKS